MTAVVDHQGTLVEQFKDALVDGRVAVACGRDLHGEGVPVDALVHIFGIEPFEHLHHELGIAHVLVVVAVIAQHQDGVLPGTGRHVLHIGNGLVNSLAGLLCRHYGEAPHAHIGFVAEQVASLAVVKQAVVVLHHKRAGSAERLHRLKAGQVVVGRGATPVVAEHTVVPRPVAEEQQVAGHLALVRSTVVEHLQEAPYGRGIARAGRELVVYLVSCNHLRREAVAFAVRLGKALSLCRQRSACGHDDDVVRRGCGAEVLVGNDRAAMYLVRGIVARCRGVADADEVQPSADAGGAVVGEREARLLRQRRGLERGLGKAAVAVGTVGGDGDCAERDVVGLHGDSRSG